MVAMRLLAQGRLAELAGSEALDIDRLMRAANLKQSAAQQYADASPRLKRFFEVYARGVNAYLFRYRDKLPAGLASSGYRPEYWKPEDSALIFCLYAFSQSVNLQEELSALTLAQKAGSDKLAWLLPGAPDEPLAEMEVDKLKGLNLASQLPGLPALAAASQKLADLDLLGSPGSANLALGPQRSRSGKSLLASDSRAAWALSPVQINTSKYQVAGLSLPGLPIVLAGYNGKLAWSSSAVMADNQDLFLEQLRRQGSQLSYLADGKWLPARARSETYFVRGQRPVREVMYDTRHGTLLAQPENASLGLALNLPQFKGDRSLDALFDLTRAKNVERAFDSTREVTAAAVNFVLPSLSTSAGKSVAATPIAAKARACCPRRAGTGVTTGTAMPTRCCTRTTRTHPRAGSAMPTSAACRAAMACSCPAPGTTPSVPNDWHSWPATVATTVAA